MTGSIYDKLGLDPSDPRCNLPELLPCTPEAAREIRAEFGLLTEEEKRAEYIGKRGPPRKPTLADYNAMLAEDGKEPMDPETYARIMGRTAAE